MKGKITTHVKIKYRDGSVYNLRRGVVTTNMLDMSIRMCPEDPEFVIQTYGGRKYKQWGVLSENAYHFIKFKDLECVWFYDKNSTKHYTITGENTYTVV